MGERVQVDEISMLMDSILDKLEVDIPNRLYNLVALRTGLHPTTVLRYHRREIDSADERVLQCVLEINEQIEGEHLSLLEEEEHALSMGDISYTDRLRWSTRKINQELKRIMILLDSDDPSPVYRYVSEVLDISPATVMCHNSGALLEHSDDVARVLRDLWCRLKSGEAVVFSTGATSGDRVVPRQNVLQLVHTIRAMEIIPDGECFESTLERMTGLGQGALGKLRDPSAPPFAPHEVHLRLAALIDRVAYEPCRSYEIGDRIHHHSLGIGTIVEKCHKSRIIVQFKSGVRRQLCEAVELRPYEIRT